MNYYYRLLLILILLIGCTVTTYSQDNKNFKDIETIMYQQENDWNKGNIDAFMECYWKNEQLEFIGKNGVTYGWKATLERYYKTYPDRAAMGLLTFTIISHEELSSDVIFTIGKWYLKRGIGDVGGHFSLLWKKKKGKWVIVTDHTS